jgi:adenylate cyclase
LYLSALSQQYVGSKHSIWLIVLLFLFATFSFFQSWFRPLDAASLDFAQRWHATRDGQPHPDILLIDIDDKSLSRMAGQVGAWPWPRSVYAYLVEGIQPHKPKAWVFDLLLSEADLDRPDDDAYWLSVLPKYHNLYLSAVRLGPDQGITQQAQSLDPALLLRPGERNTAIPVLWPLGTRYLPGRIGLINATADPDGIYRRYPLQHQIAGWHFPSLPWRFSKPNALPTQDDLWLTFQSPLTVPYPSISFADAFQLALNPAAKSQSIFAGKILIIGSSAVGLADLKHTAIAPQQPGMVLLATAIDNLLQNNALQRQADTPALALLLLQLLLLKLVYQRARGFQQFCLMSMVLLAVVVIGSAAAWISLLKQGQLMAVGTYGICLLINTAAFNTLSAIGEYQTRQRTTRLFSRFVDPRVVHSLIGQQQALAAQKCQITVLFTDIRGFTRLSEQMEAETVLKLLNDYLQLQVATLFAHQATLDKFIGDAIMAFWGAPLPQPQQADLALQAAVALVDNLEQFCARLPVDLPHFDIGIGIHTGTAIVGLLGTEQRLDYTAIGDTVNVASRLESATKEYGRILCSADTVAHCQHPHALHLIGDIQLKGRSSGIRIYRLGD